MSGLLIVEGPDGVGKSTLVTAMSQRYGATVYHFGPPNAWMPVLPQLLGPVCSSWKQPTIFDRFHFGTEAYGVEFRGAPDMSREEWYALEDVVSCRPGIVLLMMPPREFALANLERKAASMNLTEDERKYEDPARWDRVKEGMERAQQYSTLPVFELKLPHRYHSDAVLAIEQNLRWEPRT